MSQVLLITGAGSGLGLLTAQRALDTGWSVAALDINCDALQKLGDQASLLCLEADISRSEDVAKAVEACIERFGALTRVVNAAAIMPLGELSGQSPDLVLKVMSVNYGGVVNLAAAVIPYFIERKQGEFISYASMAGHWPLFYMGAYSASKSAVAAFTEVLHHEVRSKGVRVLCVCPPIVATPLLQQARDTKWPKVFDLFDPISPEQVLEAVEKALKGKKFWVLPGPLTAMSWRLRRWLPGLLWRICHWVEGFR
jgi:NAD(P)-dependent dehydrogenase (short-subunit alcohol dehydrogenase family)